MSPDDVEAASRALTSEQQTLTATVGRLDGLVDSALRSWQGADAKQFESTWRSSLRSQAMASADLLGTMAGELSRNAQEQRQASGATATGAKPTVPGAPGVRPVRDVASGTGSNDSLWSEFVTDPNIIKTVGFLMSVIPGVSKVRSVYKIWDAITTGNWGELADTVTSMTATKIKGIAMKAGNPLAYLSGVLLQEGDEIAKAVTSQDFKNADWSVGGLWGTAQYVVKNPGALLDTLMSDVAPAIVRIFKFW